MIQAATSIPRGTRAPVFRRDEAAIDDELGEATAVLDVAALPVRGGSDQFRHGSFVDGQVDPVADLVGLV